MQSVHISGGPLATFDEVIKGVDVEATAFNSRLSKARAYTKRLAVEREPKALGSFFLDGAHFKLDDVCWSLIPTSAVADFLLVYRIGHVRFRRASPPTSSFCSR